MQGDDHILQRFKTPPPLPPAPTFVPSPTPNTSAEALAGSRPIAITRHSAGADYAAPRAADMDEDGFGMSRSWDDIEGARRCAPIGARDRQAHKRMRRRPAAPASLAKSCRRALAAYST